MPRQRVKIPFRFGLDRYSGHLATTPGVMSDLRNAIIGPGRMEMRKGMDSVATLLDTTDIVGIYPMRRENVGIVIGYDSTTGDVKLYRTDENGETPNLVGTLPWTLDPGDDPPLVLMTETTQRVYIAHVALRLSERQPTVYYDPYVVADLAVMQEDLTGTDTDEDVFFRGVMSWKNYLIGWGYGNSAEARPEIVRVSRPGITEFDARHYFLAGAQRDPVVGCYEAGGTVVVFKENETHRLIGTNAANFGIEPIDQYFGLANPRLGVTVGRRCYFWSYQGPRVTDASGESFDIALPLDLEAPSPATLAESGEIEEGFAVYEPQERLVKFVFGKRVYVLTLIEPSAPQWSYFELGVPALSGGLLYGTASGSSIGDTAPPADAPILTSADPGNSTGELDLEFDHTNDPSTSNIVEVYIKSETEPDAFWFRAASVASDGTTSQPLTISGLFPAHHMEVALRYRAGAQYNAGAEDDSDPSTWPGVSLGSADVYAEAPTINSVTWERVDATTERLVINVTPQDPRPGFRVAARIAGSGGAFGNELETDTGAGSTSPYDINYVLPADESLSDRFIELEVRHWTDDPSLSLANAVADTEDDVWTGPTEQAASPSVSGETTTTFDVSFTDGSAGALASRVFTYDITENGAEATWPDDWGNYEPAQSADIAAGVTSGTVTPHPTLTSGEDFNVRVAHVKTQFSKEDICEPSSLSGGGATGTLT